MLSLVRPGHEVDALKYALSCFPTPFVTSCGITEGCFDSNLINICLFDFNATLQSNMALNVITMPLLCEKGVVSTQYITNCIIITQSISILEKSSCIPGLRLLSYEHGCLILIRSRFKAMFV